MHACMHTRTHACMHTHAHAQTQSCTVTSSPRVFHQLPVVNRRPFLRAEPHLSFTPVIVCMAGRTVGGQMAERLGSRTVNPKVAGLITGRVKWRCILGQGMSLYLL